MRFLSALFAPPEAGTRCETSAIEYGQYVRQHTDSQETSRPLPNTITTQHDGVSAPHGIRCLIPPYARQRTEKALGDAHNPFVRIRAGKSSPLLPRIIASTTTLAGTAGFVALVAWMPLLLGASRATLPVPQIEDAKSGTTIDAGTQPLKGLARRNVKCEECGLIESIRETEKDSETSEITVRLQDGSSRVMIDANPGTFRPGQRVKIIDGLTGPGA